MKRRLMIAKALSHEPTILFLDEPTAGVDVSLRRDMWDLVKVLKDIGTTIILTTHYIEEAEEMADRIGIIRKGELILVEDKMSLMKKLGKKELTLQLQHSLTSIPSGLEIPGLKLSSDGFDLTYTFDSNSAQIGIAELLKKLSEHHIGFKDLNTRQSSLEEIFVNLVNSGAHHVDS
jgi:ABC-2 type transport system ATP-binding protein